MPRSMHIRRRTAHRKPLYDTPFKDVSRMSVADSVLPGDRVLLLDTAELEATRLVLQAGASHVFLPNHDAAEAARMLKAVADNGWVDAVTVLHKTAGATLADVASGGLNVVWLDYMQTYGAHGRADVETLFAKGLLENRAIVAVTFSTRGPVAPGFEGHVDAVKAHVAATADVHYWAAEPVATTSKPAMAHVVFRATRCRGITKKYM